MQKQGVGQVAHTLSYMYAPCFWHRRRNTLRGGDIKNNVAATQRRVSPAGGAYLVLCVCGQLWHGRSNTVRRGDMGKRRRRHPAGELKFPRAGSPLLFSGVCNQIWGDARDIRSRKATHLGEHVSAAAYGEMVRRSDASPVPRRLEKAPSRDTLSPGADPYPYLPLDTGAAWDTLLQPRRY